MSNDVPMKTLTSQDMAKFHKLAPGVLKNRTPGFFLAELESGLNFFIAGIFPILGVAMWGWSATNWLVWLIVGCWVGIVCDVVRGSLLAKQVKAYCERVVDDTFVSVVSEALQANKKEVVEAHIPSVPNYQIGLLVDLIFCSVSTLVILFSVPEQLNAAVFDRSWFLPALIAFVAYRLILTAWEIVNVRKDRRGKPAVKLALGLRGAAMFILMFIVLAVFDKAGDKDIADKIVVYAVNGLWILIGVLNVWGVSMLVSETRWLKKYLLDRSDR